MSKQKQLIKINLSGGIVSTGDLLTIVKACELVQAKDIRIGTRQQLYLTITEDTLMPFSEVLETAGIPFEVNFDDHPNIVSSYVTDELFNRPNWLTEGVYADVLDAFTYQPTLKVNIIDSTQNLVPFFTGNINFIASYTSNYWYLFIRFPKMSESHQWKGMVYTQDLPALANAIEEVIRGDEKLFNKKATASIELLKEKLEDQANFFFQPQTEEFQLPKFHLPYYEGLNKYGSKLWLGIYRREEVFPLEFLKDICAICLKTKIGKIYTTPWKSILIKGIDPDDQKYWTYVLGKHHINVRHAFNELNWQVEDLSKDGLLIKRYLVRRFDSLDLRTHGLCFAIKTQPKSGLFGCIVIKRLHNPSKNQKKATDRFDILYTPDFNPNAKNYIVYKRKLSLTVLDQHLAALSHLYDEQSGLNHTMSTGLNTDEQGIEQSVNTDRWVHQCKNCLTVYDDSFGDDQQNIPAGITFEQLPKHFSCSVCASGKQEFLKVQSQSLN